LKKNQRAHLLIEY